MNIAVFHELHHGGARLAINEIAKRLKKNNKVDLYLLDDKNSQTEKEYYSNINFFNFKPALWHGHNWRIRIYKDTLELYKLNKIHKKIAKIINSKSYDLAFIHPSKYTQAPFILRYIKTKKIYYCQEPLRIAYDNSLNIKNLNKFKNFYEKINRNIRKQIDKVNIQNADIILANSKFTAGNIKKAYGLSSRVVYLGVDHKFFKPLNSKKKYDVLFIGSLNKTDGYFILLEAISNMKNNISIKIHDTDNKWDKNYEYIRNLYNLSKISLCLADNEPFGLIPLESMACGTPVIAVNKGGYSETIIHGKTGFLIKRDPLELVEKIKFLLDHENVRNDFGNNARNHILENWTWNKNTKKLEDILQRL